MISWDEFIRQMHNIADSKDPEEGHRAADDLLLEAMRFLCMSGDTVSSEDLERLIAIYHGVRKWYA